MAVKKNKKERAVLERCPIEREYLAVLVDAVPLKTWQLVGQAAAKAAIEGDARAREWLTHHLIETDPMRLTELAADKSLAHTAYEEIFKEEWRRKYCRAIRLS
ncbi:MAG TPA: hypothetical protein VHR66_29930 [Gemmataceae bacterium]|jgi:hypothetical protein|nr:hypothetical protein [Gemmataceae bacterium]